MTLPNFFVIGAGRSGTTSLQRYLAVHPGIFLADKAPSHFFCRDLGHIEDPYLRHVTANYFVPKRTDYESLFHGLKNETAIGEVSPVYLSATYVAERIAESVPDARLIALLRHSVERIFARFVARTRDGLERRSLETIIREEKTTWLEKQSALGTYLASAGCHRFLTTYFDHFPRAQIRIHLFEDFATDPRAVMRDLFEFLDVDPCFEPHTAVQHNQSTGIIGNPVLRSIWTRSALPRAKLRSYLPQSWRDAVFARFTRDLQPVQLDPDLRADLQAMFNDDITRLQDLIDRDLSHWLTLDVT